MDVKIDTTLGSYNMLGNMMKISDIILKKLKLSFCEKFVMPNRKYFNLLPVPDMSGGRATTPKSSELEVPQVPVANREKRGGTF